MKTLVMLLAGPLQSWGVRSTFNKRDTYPYPTRSGVLGMLASASGIGRSQPLPPHWEQAGLLVRRDRRGHVLTDFHTVGAERPPGRRMITADHKPRTTPVITERDYLTDAAFTAYLTAPGEVIEDLAQALRTPRWAPYLGRRGCPPALPVLLGTSDRPPQRLAEHLPLYREPLCDGNRLQIALLQEATEGQDADTHISDVPQERTPDRRAFKARGALELFNEHSADDCAGTGIRGFRGLAEALKETR
ncbi:type I-E CRISPR-associated protein Cas5/CasD [Nocardiopsis sp. CNT-189]|uniref:type I-E CRISPR-associated protein Cas5/CasD n=1 Tax=Nocardiopsis oceanisediminis TaxID=2816862 RepID=UPI003B2D0CDF